VCAESCEPFVPLLNADLVKGCNNIQFGISFGLADVVQRLMDKRKRVSVLLGNGVESTVVNAHM
jgi:hypothetical protein